MQSNTTHKSHLKKYYFLCLLLLSSFTTQAQDLGYDGNPSYTNRNISGSSVTINVRVKHKSGGAAGSSYLGYYLWPDVFSPTKYYIGQDYVSPLAGGSYSNESITVDAFGKGVPPGSYEVGFIVDYKNQVAETNENNNQAMWYHGDELVIPASPNLTVGAPHSLNNAAGGNKRFIIKIKNNGNIASGGSYVKYYISSNNNITGADKYIGQDYVASVAPGATASEEILFNPNSHGLPPGSYYVGYILDANNSVNEWDERAEDNRYAFPLPITIEDAKPDLVPTLISVSPSVVTPGQGMSATAKVKNQGTAAAPVNTKAGYYLSTNTVWGGDDVYLDENDVDPLAPGAETPEAENFNIPGGTSPGTYYILYIADHTGLVSESNEGNNISYKQITVASKPDYITQSFSTSDASLEIGQSINLNVDVKNIGASNASASSRVGYFLSTNNVFNNGDYYLGSNDVEALNAGQTTPESDNVSIPGDLGTGNMYLLAVADYLDDLSETNEGNNTSAIAVTVNNPVIAVPDLKIENAALSAASVGAGGNLDVSAKVKNIGTGNAAASKLKYFLSSDANYDGSDVELGTNNVAPIASGAFSDENATLNIPGGTTASAYYIIFMADANSEIGESNEGNNTSAVALTVTGLVGGMPANFVHTATTTSGVFYGQAQIDGIVADADDWIGAFDATGNCAGAAQVQIHDGKAYFVLTIYGDDPTTVGTDEGMNLGEKFKLQLYDASTSSYIDYTLGGAVVKFDGWINTFGTPIPAYSDANQVYNFMTGSGNVDYISLNAGWNLISIDVEPADNSVANVFSSLTPGNLQFVTGFDGTNKFYDPNGLPFLNTLTEIKKGYGYWVKVNAPEIMVVSGTPIDPNYKIDLNAGWNLVGYMPQNISAPQIHFSSLIATNNLQFVTGFNGSNLFFDPNGPAFLNTLTQLQNSKGYWVRVNNAVGGAAYRKGAGSQPNPNGMFVNGTSNIKNVGDIVEMISESGELVGKMEVLEGGYLMTTAIYGDDPMTEVEENLAIGEEVSFVYQGQTITPGVFFEGNQELQKVELNFSSDVDINVYPNPFAESVQLSYELTKNSYMSLSIYNLSGNMIDQVPTETQYTGQNTMKWAPKNIPAGIYLIQLNQNGETVATKRVVFKN